MTQDEAQKIAQGFTLQHKEPVCILRTTEGEEEIFSVCLESELPEGAEPFQTFSITTK